MTTQEFEAHVESHVAHDLDLNYCVIAMNEEAGEIAGWYKKAVLRGNPTGKYTDEDLKGELGDLLYYLTRAASVKGWTLSEIMDFNKVKLDERVAKKMRIVS
jgi:NTP pyrophosphatase (non-canonical NTP hydrolase)